MKILITGGSGMLGHNLIRVARRDHEVWGSFQTHQVNLPGCRMFPLDLTDGIQCRAKLKAIKPDVIVHTAAMTDVDRCEKERDKARRINAEGTGILAETAEELGARFVYVSTDYVFSGETGRYREDDPTSPVNFYGETKLMGEDLARRHCSTGLILRTSIYGLKMFPRQGLIESLLEALSGNKTLPRFADQFATPLYTGQLSELILQLVDLGALGLFHVGSADRISRFDFARRVAQCFAFGSAAIVPVPFKPLAGLAVRPRDSSLVSDVIEKRVGIKVPEVESGLKRLKEDWEIMRNERVARG